MAWQDVVFQYDGSFDGFLCCVFESYVHKEFPIAFYSDEECFSLYSVRSILTVPEHARRVYRGIFKRSCTVPFSPVWRIKSCTFTPLSAS